MITVHAETRIVFVKGIHKVSAIKAAIREEIGAHAMHFEEWTVVGLASDNSIGLQTAMPYHDLHEREEVGFRRRRDVTITG